MSFKIFGLQIQYHRAPSTEAKTKIIDTIKHAESIISLNECLEIIGLSIARYRSWIKRQVACLLPDQSSCPKLSPTKLISAERSKIKDYVTAKDFAHYSIASFCYLAQRKKEIVASLSAWYRIVRQYNLRRPGVRVYPPKPKIGIRASFPNQIWHLDQTIFRIINGPKVYIQAVIDNFSRYVLAWHVSETYGGEKTKALIERALVVAKADQPNVPPDLWVDSGTENLNAHVDQLVSTKLILRTVAQIDIELSNSIVEALFRSLKHRWLFMQSLTTFSQVVEAVEKYLTEHNTLIPHWAHKGGTPLEVYTGNWNEDSRILLADETLKAREARILTNKSLGCGLRPI